MITMHDHANGVTLDRVSKMNEFAICDIVVVIIVSIMLCTSAYILQTDVSDGRGGGQVIDNMLVNLHSKIYNCLVPISYFIPQSR